MTRSRHSPRPRPPTSAASWSPPTANYGPAVRPRAPRSPAPAGCSTPWTAPARRREASAVERGPRGLAKILGDPVVVLGELRLDPVPLGALQPDPWLGVRAALQRRDPQVRGRVAPV